MSTVERLFSELQGHAPWTGYDVLAVTGATRQAVDLRVDLLRHHFRATPLRVIGVVDDRDRGNLHGTLDAWTALRASLGDHERGALLHDAGRATRTAPLTWFGDGTRGGMDLGARWCDEPVPWIALVALGLQAFATASTHVDVFWGSQLLVPHADDHVQAPTAALHKLARQPTGPVSRADRLDLGWFGWSVGADAPHFEAQGTLRDPEAFEAFRRRHARVAADLGSASWSRDLLDTLVPLATERAQARLDVDPDLTRPWLARLAGYDAPSALVDRLLALRPDLSTAGSVDVRAVQADWWRLRRPEEVQALLTDLARGHATLRRLWGVRHPIERSVIGSRWIEGPEVTFEEVDRGLSVDGVYLHRAVVRRSALVPGSTVAGGVVLHASGALRVEDGAIVRSAGDLTLKHGLAWHLNPPRAATVDDACAVSLTADEVLTHPHGAAAPTPRRADQEGVWRAARWWLPSPEAAFHPGFTRELTTLWETVEADPSRSGELIEHLLVPWGDALCAQAARAAHRVLSFGWARRPDLPGVRRDVATLAPDVASHIVVLSRVSVGADIAVVTPLLLRLRRRWPDARLTVVGGRLGDLLPAGAVPVEITFDRQSTLDARVDAWRAVDRVVRSLDPDLVIGPASRLDQVGTLPLGDAPYAAVDLLLEDRGTMAARVNRWCDAWMHPGAHAVPTLAWHEAEGQSAAAFDRRVRFRERHGVALKLGVGGDRAKAMSEADEVAWLLHLLDRGPVLLDLGLGATEVAHGQRLVDAARRAGHRVDELDGASAASQLVTWQGGLAAWAALVHHAQQALGYDSAQGHLAAADRQRGAETLPGTPTTVLFVADVAARFLEAWTPSGSVPVRAIRSAPDDVPAVG